MRCQHEKGDATTLLSHLPEPQSLPCGTGVLQRSDTVPGEGLFVYRLLLETSKENLPFRHLTVEEEGGPGLAARVNSPAQLLTQTCTDLNYATHVLRGP